MFFLFSAGCICFGGEVESVSAASREAGKVAVFMRQSKSIELLSETIEGDVLVCADINGRIRWQTFSPYESILIFDGKELSQYEKLSGGWKKLSAHSRESVKKIISEISKLGYTPIKQINIDTKLISGIKSICYIITFSMLLMSFVNISLYIAKSINDRKREFGIYKTFGYRNKDILKLILSETLFVEILGFLLALIVYSVLYFIAYYVTNYSSVIFSRFIIEFSFVSICISLIYIILLPCLYSLMFIKKIKNINPIDIINK